MTAQSKRNVLVIGVDAETFSQVTPILKRGAMDVDRFPRARESLDLVEAVAFDALILGFPLTDMPLEEFLEAIRRPESSSRKSPVLLLCTDGGEEVANGYLGKGVSRVVSLAMAGEQLQRVISGLLEVAPRIGARVMARLEIQLAKGKTLAMCQTENLSSSGMLIRTYVGYPLGTRLAFEFNLPTDPLPVRGEAEVVRHTLVDRETVSGVGTRFLSFEGDGEVRYRRYVNQHKAAAEAALHA